jgi:hypothetical protein
MILHKEMQQIAIDERLQEWRAKKRLGVTSEEVADYINSAASGLGITSQVDDATDCVDKSESLVP